jgi:hypothetical protein
MLKSVTRRGAFSAIAAAAAVPTATLPALAGEADPIHAAIRAHRQAYQAFADAVTAESEFAERANTKGWWIWSGLDPVPPADCPPGWAAVQMAVVRASDAEAAAALKLLRVRPTTVTGCLALLRRSYEFVATERNEWPDYHTGPDEGGNWNEQLVRHVADALEIIANA